MGFQTISPKNGMVAEHYTALGFNKLDNTVTAQWQLNIEDYQSRECYIIKNKK